MWTLTGRRNLYRLTRGSYLTNKQVWTFDWFSNLFTPLLNGKHFIAILFCAVFLLVGCVFGKNSYEFGLRTDTLETFIFNEHLHKIYTWLHIFVVQNSLIFKNFS